MRILITGASGYIGGSVATKLLANGHHIIGLARTEQSAASLAQRGIEPLLGTLSDHGALEKAARNVDAVINAAQADNPFVVHAILPQLYRTGKAFIQTSGSSVVSSYDRGEYVDRIFNEDTPVTPMPEKATRYAIDRQVLLAALDGVRSVVIRPGLIYGKGLGVGSTSVQIPRLIENASISAVRHVGRGLNVWSHVHINDVVELYELALQSAPAGSLFYAENGEASMKSTAEAISRMLGFAGRSEEWTIDDAVTALGPSAHLTFGSNSRVQSLKARKMLGWSPKGPTLIHEIEHGVYKDVHGNKNAH
jgi:nucleoside-diphosphate-sugar epimerase